MEESYDVVVIGSGFGGAVTACRLAQAGKKVCILEQGKEWKGTDFPRSTHEVSNSFWIEGESLGLLEYRTFKGTDVLQGCGVGGGSLVYFNAIVRTPVEIFKKLEWPKTISREVMDPYYDLVKDMLDACPLSPPEGREMPLRTDAFLDTAKESNNSPELLDIAVYTGKDRINPHGGEPQSACDYCGNCGIGCVLHAKNTLDLNYIPLARKFGAHVFPLHRVDKIEPVDGKGYKVHFDQISPENPAFSTFGTVIGKKVVIAASTLGSTEILLRNKLVHKTLPNVSDMLGKRFSGNGDFLLAGTVKTDRVIDPARGPSITSIANFSNAENSIFIEDLGFPDPFLWYIEGSIPKPSRIKNLFAALLTYGLSAIGLSTGKGRIEFEIDRLFKGGFTPKFLPYLAMGTDAGNGILRLKRGSVYVDWFPSDSDVLYGQIIRGIKELGHGLGGTYLNSLLWEWPLKKLLTAHPLGGCVMGDNRGNSVVNEVGAVWGYNDLYVIDGSIVPSALSVNPSMTIAALAERCSFWMNHGREMTKDDPDTPETIYFSEEITPDGPEIIENS